MVRVVLRGGMLDDVSSANSKYYMIDRYGDLSFSDGAAKAESGNQFAMVRALFRDAEWIYWMEVEDGTN